MNIQRRAKAIVKQYGSYRKAAAATGIGYAYLFKLANGDKKNPTHNTMRKLGLL